jgi:hypothetical protein
MLAPGIAMTLIGAAMTLIGVGYYASKMIVCNESIAHVIARHLPQTVSNLKLSQSHIPDLKWCTWK